MKKILFTSIILFFSCYATYAQGNQSRREQRQARTVEVQRMIEMQDYKFVAQRTNPMQGRSISLTSAYDLRVGNDTISAYLPYFGRAYIAPMDPLDGGIKFESSDFTYQLEQARRGGWIAKITIRDARHRIDMVLQISTNGSASLSVNDVTRQPITFSGIIGRRK